jgi:hypothetical protein
MAHAINECAHRLYNSTALPSTKHDGVYAWITGETATTHHPDEGTTAKHLCSGLHIHTRRIKNLLLGREGEEVRCLTDQRCAATVSVRGATCLTASEQVTSTKG